MRWIGLAIICLFAIMGFSQPAQSAEKAIITFTFDDGRVSVYQNAFVKLNDLGLPANVYVITNLVGKDDSQYMNWSQIITLSRYGWEIGSHSHTHKHLPKLTDKELIYELDESIRVLNAYRIKPQAFAAPHGTLDERTLLFIKERFTSHRRAWKPTDRSDDLNTLKDLDRFNVEAFELKNTTTVEQAKRLINRAIEERKWLVFLAHSIVDTESQAKYQFSVVKFNEIVNYVAVARAEGKVEVLTVSQALGYGEKNKGYGEINGLDSLFVQTGQAENIDTKEDINTKVSMAPIVAVNETVPETKSNFPLGYPFSSWGELRWGEGDIEEGLVLDSYFEQGVDWWRWDDLTFNSFVGLRLVQSSESRDYWNNKLGPWFGVKVKHPFRIFPEAWGEVGLGVRGEYYHYTSSAVDDNDDLQVVPFFQWSFGGDWKRWEAFFAEEVSNFPLGYPFSSWGEVRYTSSGDIEEGLVLDAYLEQGVDWWQWNKLTFNSFVGLRLVQSSDDSDYWNNKFGPWFGVKVKQPFRIFPKAWGEVSLGVRGEYYHYTSSAVDDDNDLLVMFFLQWSFGGDWNDFNKGGW